MAIYRHILTITSQRQIHAFLSNATENGISHIMIFSKMFSVDQKNL